MKKKIRSSIVAALLIIAIQVTHSRKKYPI